MRINNATTEPIERLEVLEETVRRGLLALIEIKSRDVNDLIESRNFTRNGYYEIIAEHLMKMNACISEFKVFDGITQDLVDIMDKYPKVFRLASRLSSKGYKPHIPMEFMECLMEDTYKSY